MIDFLSHETQANPYATLSLMREKFPVCQIEPGNAWALTRYHDAQYALKRHDLFSAAGVKSIVAPDWLAPDCRRELFLATEDPPEHTPHRDLVNKAFVSGVINSLIPLMRKAAQQLLDQIFEKPSPCEFMEDFSFPYTDTVINSIIGISDQQKVDDIRQWVHALENLTIVRPSDSEVAVLESATRHQTKILTNIINDRREKPRDDFVTKLVNSPTEGFELTDKILVNILDMLITAGYMTTVHILGNTVLQLSRHPDLIVFLQNNPDMVPNLVEEILRLYSPLLCTLRKTTEPITLHDTVIPNDAIVLIYTAAANRDPRVFANPDEIDLNRPNIKDHIAFGSGAHVCIGLGLARLEIKIAVETILQNVNTIQCPADSELHWRHSMVLRGLKSLPVHFI